MTPLERLVRPIVARWLTGQRDPETLDRAYLLHKLDRVTYVTLSRCTGWRTQHDRTLLIGNGILTAPVIRELVRSGYMGHPTADDLMPAVRAIAAASHSAADTRTIRG